MTGQNMSQTRQKTYGRSAAPLVEALEERGATVVSAQELAAIRGVKVGSPVLNGLIRRLTASGWLAPLARRGMYQFVSVRLGQHASNDELLELEALAQAPNAPRFQIALGTAAFLRGYADTAPRVDHLLFDKHAGVRPPRLTQRFQVIRTDPARLFGAEPLSSDKRVPVSTASRLFIDVALYWRHAGDLRLRDHWLLGAARDVDAELTTRWARQLGPSAVARVGYLAERFGAHEVAALLAASVKRNTLAAFGPPRKGRYNARWHVYDSLGIGQSA